MRLTWAQPEDLLGHELRQAAEDGRDPGPVQRAWSAAGGHPAPERAGASPTPAPPHLRALAARLLDELARLPSPSAADEPTTWAAIAAACPTSGSPAPVAPLPCRPEHVGPGPAGPGAGPGPVTRLRRAEAGPAREAHPHIGPGPRVLAGAHRPGPVTHPPSASGQGPARAPAAPPPETGPAPAPHSEAACEPQPARTRTPTGPGPASPAPTTGPAPTARPGAADGQQSARAHTRTGPAPSGPVPEAGPGRKPRAASGRDAPVRAGGDGLRERLEAAWVGRAVGCLLGKPVEKLPLEGIRALARATGNWPLGDWFTARGVPPALLAAHPWNRRSAPTSLAENIDGMPEDDDLNYPLLGLLLLQRHGKAFTTADVARLWLDELPAGRTFTAERVAYRNLLLGLEPPPPPPTTTPSASGSAPSSAPTSTAGPTPATRPAPRPRRTGTPP